MKKIAIKVVSAVLLLSFMAGTKVVASPVDTNTAKIVAKNFLQRHDVSVKSLNNLRISNVSAQNGFSKIYIVENITDNCFVVVSADNCVQPVLAYSTTSVASQQIPLNFREWLQGYNMEIEYCVANNLQATEEIISAWRELSYTSSNGRSGIQGGVPMDPLQPQTITIPVVGPLLTTTWNQTELYNNYCPIDTVRNKRTVVGCVAMVMAQVMKYWNYPAHGIGSNSYLCVNDSCTIGTLSANFANATYNYANMPDALSTTSSAAQIDAVATLMYHCGVAVNMIYNVSSVGSEAFTNGNNYPTAEYALKTYFGFKNTLATAERAYFTDARWDSLLRSELNANRPVIYDGRGGGGGHAFICDGYDNDGYFHFNWGWGGNYDGYYITNRLSPRGGGVGSNSSNNYNSSQKIICGVEPNSNANLVVRPETMAIPAVGGTHTIAVLPSYSDTNRWTATTDVSWIALLQNSGAGSGTAANVSILVQQNNTGNNRRGTITFVQHNDTATVVVEQRYGQNSISGLYGNVQHNYTKALVNGSTIVLRPECYGRFTPGDTVKSVFFTSHYISGYPQYADSVFTIRIYENPTYTTVLSQGNYDSAYNVLGTQVYTQTYYQHTQGNQMVDLTTPYVVNSNKFWVSITSEGQAFVRYFRDVAVDSVLIANYPVADSITGMYLEGRGNKVRAAIDYKADTNGYYVQYNSCYAFAIKVSTFNPDLFITAKPDSANHGYVLGGGPHNLGDTITLQAYDLPGFTFSRWGDGVLANPRTFVADTNFYPNFVAVYNARTSYTLSVTSSNSQLGTTSGSGTYFAGDTAVAVAIPADSTKYFLRWNDNNTTNPRSVVMNANAQLAATFASLSTSTIAVHDTIHDTIYINVAVHDTVHDTAYINLPQHNFNISSANSAQGVTVGTGTYPQGLRIGIAAVPNDGYRFSHWSDNSTDNPRHFTVSGDVTLTAHFTTSSQAVPAPDKSAAIDIYSNPTTGFITLSQFAEKVEVLDNWGRLVAVAENVINMDLSDLAEGTHTLRISTQGTVVLKKVVKR
ncbi:MAG: C10 family peptidase [Bacteroidales bacterium]|nr:C10 family peptidase [Bacteroidales bacterium]